MAIEYVPMENLFTWDFTEKFIHAVRNINSVFDKFFEIGYKIEGNINEEWEMVEYLKLTEYSKQILTIGGITIAIIVITLIAIGIAILWNQRKIKKQLKQLLEEREKEDKP